MGLFYLFILSLQYHETFNSVPNLIDLLFWKASLWRHHNPEVPGSQQGRLQLRALLTSNCELANIRIFNLCIGKKIIVW